MSDFETVECRQCGDEFKPSPDANAADRETCSPQCETAAN